MNLHRQTFNMMADFDNPAFDIDGVNENWEEDIGDDDVLSTSLHDADDTSGVNSMGTSIQTSLQQELLQTAVDDYYNQLGREGLTPALGREPGRFELVGGRLRLKA